MKNVEAKALKREGEVLGGCCLGNLEQEANTLEWPQVVVAHRFPEQFRSDRLAIRGTSMKFREGGPRRVHRLPWKSFQMCNTAWTYR
jgi:hypothetical protein